MTELYPSQRPARSGPVATSRGARECLSRSSRQRSLRPISVVVADDHPICLEGMISVLTAHRDLEIVGACENIENVPAAVHTLSPDIVILGMSVGDRRGRDVLDRIESSGTDTKIILLTPAKETRTESATRGRLRAVVSKLAPVEDLLLCVRTVALAGTRSIPFSSASIAPAPESTSVMVENQSAKLLTSREREIIALIAEGMSNKEAARHFGLSEGTIKVHLHNIFSKLRIANRAALAVFSQYHWQSS